MAIEHDFPFFEVDAVARVAWPYGHRFAGLRVLDFDKAAELNEARELRRRWNAWPRLSDFLKIAERSTLNAEGKGTGKRRAMFATPLPRFDTRFHRTFLSAPEPPGDPEAWMKTKRQSHIDAFYFAKHAAITTGNAHIWGDTRDAGAAEEDHAFQAARALIARSINGQAGWDFRGMPLPPMVRVVAHATQMINDLDHAATGARLDMVHVYDQAFAFQVNRIMPGSSLRTEPDPQGEILLLIVEIDGADKWTKHPQGTLSYTAQGQSDRSRVLLSKRVDVFRIDGASCATVAHASKNFEALWRAINSRVFAEAVLGNRASELVYLSDSEVALRVQTALEERGLVPPSPRAPRVKSAAVLARQALTQATQQAAAGPNSAPQSARRRREFSLRRNALRNAAAPGAIPVAVSDRKPNGSGVASSAKGKAATTGEAAPLAQTLAETDAMRANATSKATDKS